MLAAHQQDYRVNLFDSKCTATRALVICLLLVAVCYANSIPNAFILDDILIVGANERIRHIDPVHVLFQSYWGDLNHAGIYRPLTIFTFSLEYPVWKVWAPGFRITNLLLHAMNGWLVFLLARGLLGSPAAALAAAVVYLVHPIQTEAVVSIVGRSELLAAGLFFAAWLAFRKGRIWLAAPAYFLAALAKESAITFPAIVMLEVALTQGGIRKIVESWRRFAVLAVTGIAYLCLRFYVLGGLGIPPTGQYLNGKLTLGERWITSGRVFLEYFRLILVPVRIASDYDFNSVPVARFADWDAWLGLLVVAAMMIFALRFAKVRPAVSFGILFFFIVLLPVSNWIMPIALLMAERFLYTPILGFALLAGLVWAGIQDRGIRRLVAGGFVSLAALLCISHNYVWQDTLTFHQNAVQVVPNNARVRLGYGFALLRMDKVQEAREQFEAGLRILPDSAPLLAGLASATMKLDGRCDRVRPLLLQALAHEPGQWHSLWVLGDCFMMENKTDQAEQSYRLAIQNTEFPDAKLLFSWGRILEKTGKTPAAVAAYERAALIDPTDEGIKTKLQQLERSN
jgi:tetratricopeptide (TPR) repeat protein